MRTWIMLAAMMGCSVSEADFPEKSAQAICKKADRCDELDGTREDCEEGWANLVEGVIDVADALGADYDPAKGGECIRHIKALECDELDDWADDDECDVMVSG